MDGKNSEKALPVPITGKKLLLYTMSAGAALSLAARADAAVRVTDVDVWVSLGVPYNLDVDNNPGHDFNMSLFTFPATIRIGAMGCTDGASFASSGGWMKKFTPGQWVSAGAGPWNATVGKFFQFTQTGGGSWVQGSGNFTPANTGYAGVRFDAGPGLRYGWVHIDQIAADGSQYHIDGYAYEDDGGPIQIPGTRAVPSVHGKNLALFALALGAVGIAAMRRKKQTLAD